MPAIAKSDRMAADLLRAKRRRAEETEERAVRLQSYIPQGAAIIKACATAAPACVVCPFLPSPFALRTAGFSAMARRRQRFGESALTPVFYRKHF